MIVYGNMGPGTGLGLSITYGIVREHEATIQCDSAPGTGTRFEIRFAAVPEQGASSDSPGRQVSTRQHAGLP